MQQQAQRQAINHQRLTLTPDPSRDDIDIAQALAALSLVNRPIGPASASYKRTEQPRIRATRPLKLPAGMVPSADASHIAALVRDARDSTRRPVYRGQVIPDAATIRRKKSDYSRLSHLSLIGLSVSALILMGASFAA